VLISKKIRDSHRRNASKMMSNRNARRRAAELRRRAGKLALEAVRESDEDRACFMLRQAGIFMRAASELSPTTDRQKRVMISAAKGKGIWMKPVEQ
jgi:hypothetical protein